MNRYKIVKPISLDFLTPRDQETRMFEDGFVDWNGEEKSWYVNPAIAVRLETINWGWLIQKYIDDGCLVLVG